MLKKQRENQTWAYKARSCSFARAPCLESMQLVVRKSPRCLWRRDNAYMLQRIWSCSLTPCPSMSCCTVSMNLKRKKNWNKFQQYVLFLISTIRLKGWMHNKMLAKTHLDTMINSQCAVAASIKSADSSEKPEEKKISFTS